MVGVYARDRADGGWTSCWPVQGANLKNDRTPSRQARSAIEPYIAPSELRGTHNFASAAQPIMNLALETTPPPLRPHHAASVQAEGPDVRLSADTLSQTDFYIESQNSEIDPPFRAPSIWQNKPPASMGPRSWQWNERSIAAFLGFAAGVLIIVPLVFFLSMTTDQGRPGGQPAASETLASQPVVSEERTPVAPPPAPKVAAANAISAGSWFDVRTTEPVEPAAPDLRETSIIPEKPPSASVAPVRHRPGDAQESELRARAALAAGRLGEARAALRAAASPDTPHLWFQLAETYDPLVSRAAGAAEPPATSDKMTAADIKFARFYYQQALTHGVGAARARLDALTRP